ncbi:3-oxoacyl-(acyl-carrier-protein) reductase FabG [Mesorhizobium sp. SOD10]|nr:3-oxoacyl-(acyl-carrier-protein) reductase FabG [Mesorhizobium sp. SOD10]
MSNLEGATAIVTGAASGIGLATAKLLSARGAQVVRVDINKAGLAAETLPGPEITVTGDGGDRGVAQDVLAAALNAFGAIDIVVANAGIWWEKPFLDLTDDDWDRIMRVNLRGPFVLTQTIADWMVKKQRPGSIVFTASTNSFVAEPATAHYNASKGAILMLMKSMAVDLAEYGIRVNAVAPGTIRTNLNAAALANGDEFAMPPARRWGTAEECAEAICFLAAPTASYVTGEVLVVDGGQTALNGVVRGESS